VSTDNGSCGMVTRVGLDVHKDGIVVAVAEGGGAGRSAGIWPNREHAGGIAAAGLQTRLRRGGIAVLR
jgi:hypothetical protein